MNISKLVSVLILLLFFSVGYSQNEFKAVPNSDNSILIEGTSNIHDWEIIVKDYTSKMDLSMTDDLEKVNSVSLSIPVKSFDSGKSKMDKNTYEAMEADIYELVAFISSAPAELKQKSAGIYQALIKGELTISGTSNKIEIPVELHETAKGYTLKAKQDLNMLDYKIDPPTALFGTISTGDTVTIIFNLTHYKS